MAKRNRFAGLIGRRGAQAAQDGPDDDERPEAEDDADEESAEAAEADAEDDDDDEEAEDASDSDAGKAAVRADRKRVATITGHKAASDLPTLAGHLALNTELSAKAAGKILSAAAEDLQPGGNDASTATKALERMEADNPNVGANGDGGGKAGPSLSAYVQREVEAKRLN